LDIKKSLIFDTGRYERVWVKNCLAVGLSTGFIEPLEATSLWSSLQQLDFFRHFINELKTPKASSIQLYNKLVSNHYEEKMEYVYMHYCTKRTDTEFWRNFTKNYPMPENLVEKFELIKENNLRHFDIDRSTVIGHFSLYSYLQTCSGLGMFTNDIDITGYENIQPSPIDYKRITDFMLSKAVNHTEFLNSLKTGK
jgi:tryptophan halogenase